MRVAQIIDILYFGGAQTMQVMFAQAIRKHPDIDLTVVSLRDNVHNTTIPDQLESLGARVAFFPSKKLLNLARLWRLTNFLRRGNFDVVHTHLPYANILGTLAGRLAGIPVIASIRNSRDDDWGRYYVIRQRLETFVLRFLTQRVMAVGHATAEAHQHRLGNKLITAVPNAFGLIPSLSSNETNRIRAELVSDPDRPLLVSVGRLVQQKGYGDLLTAFAEVRRGYPAAALVIAGDGPLHGELEAQIDLLNLNEHVRLLGSRLDVPRLLAASDIFVSSSHWEGLSVAILEAMAAGLPVVATNVGDTPRVVVEGTGLIIPPQEPALLAEAISSLLGDSEQGQSFGATAQTFIEQKYNPTAWANKILALYKSVQKTF